jgi:hypothetical protein
MSSEVGLCKTPRCFCGLMLLALCFNISVNSINSLKTLNIYFFVSLCGASHVDYSHKFHH